MQPGTASVGVATEKPGQATNAFFSLCYFSAIKMICLMFALLEVERNKDTIVKVTLSGKLRSNHL